jgi:hypothetical protein
VTGCEYGNARRLHDLVARAVGYEFAFDPEGSGR